MMCLIKKTDLNQEKNTWAYQSKKMTNVSCFAVRHHCKTGNKVPALLKGCLSLYMYPE